MSWGTCYAGSNNIHFDFPPIMADGRNYASWMPGAAINEKIRNEAGIKTNWQYRQYMVDNADAIIKANQVEACNQCCSCPAMYGDGAERNNNTPYLYKNCVEKTQPHGYQNSDLKNLYLSKYQLQCRLNTPVLTQEQLLQARYPNYN
tara:strand:- start:1311 stop:1751 length:441 start_codon:yes stop_codon:yes gene_type:complete